MTKFVRFVVRLVLGLLYANTVRRTVAAVAITGSSVQCDPQMMHVFFEFPEPFYGTIYARDFHNNKNCRVYGEGTRKTSVSYHLLDESLSRGYCGMRLDEGRQEFYISLVVSDQREILVHEGVQEFQVRCAYNLDDVTLKLPALQGIQISHVHDAPAVPPILIQGQGTGILPVVEMTVRDGWGIDGRRVQAAAIGQEITLDIHLADNVPYDFIIFNCIAHDGTRAPAGTITLVDDKGCAQLIERVQEGTVQITHDHKHIKHTHLRMRGFQFSTSDVVNFECQIRPCLNRCNITQCTSEPIQRKSAIVRRSLTADQLSKNQYVLDEREEIVDLTTSILVLPESEELFNEAPVNDIQRELSPLPLQQQSSTSTTRMPKPHPIVNRPLVNPPQTFLEKLAAEMHPPPPPAQIPKNRADFLADFRNNNDRRTVFSENELGRQVAAAAAASYDNRDNNDVMTKYRQQIADRVSSPRPQRQQVLAPNSNSNTIGKRLNSVRLADDATHQSTQSEVVPNARLHNPIRTKLDLDDLTDVDHNDQEVSGSSPSSLALVCGLFVTTILLSVCFMCGYALYARRHDELHTNTLADIDLKRT